MSPELFISESPVYTTQIITINGDWMSHEDDEKILSSLNGVELIRLRTGLDFLECFGAMRTRLPLLVMGEINLPLMDPMPNPPNAPRYLKLGCYDRPNTVGLRCLQMIAEDPATQEVPIVLNTLFEEYDLKNLPSGLAVPAKAKIINKLDSDYTDKLVAFVKETMNKNLGGEN